MRILDVVFGIRGWNWLVKASEEMQARTRNGSLLRWLEEEVAGDERLLIGCLLLCSLGRCPNVSILIPMSTNKER